MRRDWARLSAGGAVGKGIGAAREILLARFFGTGAVADAYRGSLTLTLSPVHLLTTKAVQNCFVPLYARYASSNPAKGRALFQSLLLFFVALGLLLAGALALFAGPLVEFVLRGFDPERSLLAERMLRIFAAGVPFYIYCSVLGALGAAQKDFLIPSLRPGLQNLGMTALIVVAARRGEPALAAYGFTATYAALALWATAHLARRGLLPLRPALDRELAREAWARLWVLLRPLVVLSLLVEANILIERNITSRIGPGSVAGVDYARFLTESVHFLLAVPLGLLGLAYFADLGDRETSERADRMVALLLLATVPISVFLAINGRDVLSILYLRGKFDEHSLAITGRALIGLGAGLWAFSASHVLQRVLNARLRNGEVLRGEALSVALNVACNVLLYRSLGVLAIGIGAAVGPLASFLYYLRRIGPGDGTLRRTALHLLAAAPFYAFLSLAAGRLAGGGAIGLATQCVLAAGFWAAVFSARAETRGLILEKAGRRDHR
ncbi:MAG: hypothetical protein JW958_13255 [Candidatus Eisenbacteria bacterium]|nr:hypothetical protein [Candidatus Eisenbacteria bacterium]